MAKTIIPKKQCQMYPASPRGIQHEWKTLISIRKSHQCDQIGLILKDLSCKFYCLQKQPKCLVNFWGVLENATFSIKETWLLFGHFLEKLGLLFLPTSGHTKGLTASQFQLELLFVSFLGKKFSVAQKLLFLIMLRSVILQRSCTIFFLCQCYQPNIAFWGTSKFTFNIKNYIFKIRIVEQSLIFYLSLFQEHIPRFAIYSDHRSCNIGTA